MKSRSSQNFKFVMLWLICGTSMLVTTHAASSNPLEQYDIMGRSSKNMLIKSVSSVSEFEDELNKLETALGPIQFKEVPNEINSDLSQDNAAMLSLLLAAIAPFHEYAIANAKHLSSSIEKTKSVDAASFRNLDRALFGHQAIMRKLLALEAAYSGTIRPTVEMQEQVLVARVVAANLAADFYHVLFTRLKTRNMIKDLLSEERPLSSAYRERNKELQAQFIRALDTDERASIVSKVGDFERLKEKVAPFSISKIEKVIKERENYSNLSFSPDLSNTMAAATYLLSKIFGQVAGNVKFRQGHLLHRKDVTDYMAAKLKPFDILFDKAPFALTDRFIPGHYTHAAIYLGTKKQLINLGLWNHSALKPYRSEIEKGKVIVEALRPGTKMSYLAEFQNVDEIAAYRVDGIYEQKAELNATLETLMAQIGKDYDFNFDVSTTSAIVCSELVYHSMAQIHWPTAMKVGRETITPDNLAQLAYYREGPLKLVFDIYANTPGDFQERTNREVAELLGFVSKGNNRFEKLGQYCYNETQSNIRVGSRRDRYLVMRKCSETSDQMVYN